MPTLALTYIYPYRYNDDIPLDAYMELGFGQPVVAGSGAILFYRGEQQVLAIDINSASVRFEGGRVLVDPPDFMYGQAYAIKIPPGVIKAANGDAVNAEESTSFRVIRTPQPQTITGTDGADTIDGGNASDVLDGAGGNDQISGWDGNDVLRGGSGDDTLDGGKGDDVLDGGDGNDIVKDSAGHVDHGQGMAEVARYFMASAEFLKLYGTAPTNAGFVTRLYHNVLHREPETGGYNYWLEALDSKRATQLDILNTFAESPENVANVAKLIGDSISYHTNPIYYPA